MRIISWNVNSIRLRLPLVKKLIRLKNPDILCLQETKCLNEFFPQEAFEALGYPYMGLDGIKSYNGVAILSKHKLSKIEKYNFCARQDARHMKACIKYKNLNITIHNLYVPAGGDEPDPSLNPKFAHKLAFLRQMGRLFQDKHQKGGIFLLGDFNIAPKEHDVWSHQQLKDVVSHTDVEIKTLNQVLNKGQWIDIARDIYGDEKKLYSWWSYRNRNWKRANRGRRLDHIWANPKAFKMVKDFNILVPARDWQCKKGGVVVGPSDHVPLIMDCA